MLQRFVKVEIGKRQEIEETSSARNALSEIQAKSKTGGVFAKKLGEYDAVAKFGGIYTTDANKLV